MQFTQLNPDSDRIVMVSLSGLVFVFSRTLMLGFVLEFSSQYPLHITCHSNIVSAVRIQIHFAYFDQFVYLQFMFQVVSDSMDGWNHINPKESQFTDYATSKRQDNKNHFFISKRHNKNRHDLGNFLLIILTHHPSSRIFPF